jgi:hypothetical protein
MPTISADDTYYVDHSSDPTFAPGNFISLYPEALTFDDMIRGVGNVAYQISFSALDQDGNTVVNGYDFVGPYRSYYRLRYGNIAIMAGVIVSTHLQRGMDFISVAGKTWEHFPERWQYPFDGRTSPPSTVSHVNDFVYPNTFIDDELIGSGVATPTGLAYQANNRDLIYILGDLFSETMNVPDRLIFDIASLATLCGIKTNYQFSLGDSSFLSSIIDGLSGTGNGFDWWISHDMRFLWGSPYRFGNPSVPAITYTFDSTNPDDLDDLQFTNNGPAATHVTGKGAGLATQTTLSRSFGYSPAQDQFSRLDQDYDFGDVRNIDQLILKTQKQLSKDLQPQHEIPLQLDPSKIPDYWSIFRKGRAIYIDQDLIAHHIDSPQQLKSYEAKMDEQGNVQVDWTLEQIYDLSINAGTPEG